MSWEPELEELRRREALAREMGGDERVARQHASGRRTVRERIERLFDPGTFHETGALAGRGTYGDDGKLSDFLPANTVVGQGRIDGRRAAVEGDDFTIRGGAADAAIWEKTVYAERTAHDLRLPLVRLVDGTARRDRRAAGGGDLAVQDRGALQRRGDHRPARHPPDPVRLVGARSRADSPRASPGTNDARPPPVI
jgi:acetyl-CoA carboxylase carboxyltransferase component